MPSTSSPCFNTRAVKSQSASRHRAWRRLGLEHRAIFVERRELAGQFVKVIAQEIRPIFLRHGLQRQPEIQQMLGQRNFFRRRQVRVLPMFACPMFETLSAGFPEDAADPRIGVLQIRRGVAVERQHLVPTEHVIALAVRQQVGVFHRAQADDARDFAPLRLRQLRVFFRDNLEGPLFGFVQQIGQLHRLAGARFERLAVLAQNRAEPDMGQFDCGLRIAARDASGGTRRRAAGNAIAAGRR